MDAFRHGPATLALLLLASSVSAESADRQLEPDDLMVLLAESEPAPAAAPHELPAWVEPTGKPLPPANPAAMDRVAADDSNQVASGSDDIATLLEEQQRLETPPMQAIATDQPPSPSLRPGVLSVAQLERAATGRRSEHGLSRLIALSEQTAEQVAERTDEWRRLVRLRVWALHTRGELRVARGDAGGALADFEAALAIEPDAILARHSRAISLAEAGRSEEALADFDRVIQAEPDWPEARRNRAALHLSQGRIGAALADCDAAIAAAPPLGAEGDRFTRAVLHLRGTIYKRIGRNDDALADFTDAIVGASAGTAIAQSHVERASIHLERGDYAAATDDCFAALEANPRNAEAYRGLAWLLAATPDKSQRDPVLAAEAAQRARALLGDTPETLEAAAVAYAATGRALEAQRLQMKAIRMSGATEDRRVRLAAYEAGEAWTLPAGEGVVRALHEDE